MPVDIKAYGFSSDSDDGNSGGEASDSQRKKRQVKSPKYHDEYLVNNDYDSAITGAINVEKTVAKNAMKQQNLKPPLRLRQTIASQNKNENETSSATQSTLKSTESQSNVMFITQESPTMDVMSLKQDIENMREEIRSCQENYKKYLDKALSDHFVKIKNLIDENNGTESSIHDERANMIISAIENISVVAPSRRKVAKNNNDICQTGGTWNVMVGEEKTAMYLVNLDVRRLVIATNKDVLVSCKRAPDPEVCKFLDKHMDINSLARDVAYPQKLAMAVADIMFPREVQIFFKFYHSLTRTSKRSPLPEDKMRTFKKALMYCGMGSLCVKDERKTYYTSAIEALNGRASHWSLGSKRTDYASDDCDTLWQISDFPWPEDYLNKKVNDENVPNDM